MRQQASRALTTAGKQSYSLLQQEKITKIIIKKNIYKKRKKQKALKVAEDANPVQ